MSERRPGAVEAAVREFLHRAGALRVTVLVDRGPARSPMVVDALDDGTLEVELGPGEEGPGQDGAPAAVPVPDVRAMPPLHVTRTAEGVDLPLVQLAYLAGHVRAFAQALGGRSVATVHLATSDPALPLVIGAREGEPLVVVLGEEAFPLPDGWPE